MTKSTAAYLDITSWVGLSIGARHYYGKIVYYDDTANRDGKEYKSPYINFDVKKTLTAKEAIQMNKIDREGFFGDNSLLAHWKKGEQTNRFDTEEEVIEYAKDLFNTVVVKQLPHVKFLINGRSGVCQPQPILIGDAKIMKQINDLYDKSEAVGGWEGSEKKMQKICDKWDKIVNECGIRSKS